MRPTATVALAAALVALTAVAAPAQQVERVTMAGSPLAGMFGIFATGIGTYLSKAVPNLNVSVAATAGSVENLRRIDSGDAEIGMSFAGDVHEGYNGLEKFQGKPLTNVRAVGVVFARLLLAAPPSRRPPDDDTGREARASLI